MMAKVEERVFFLVNLKDGPDWMSPGIIVGRYFVIVFEIPFRPPAYLNNVVADGTGR